MASMPPTVPLALVGNRQQKRTGSATSSATIQTIKQLGEEIQNGRESKISI
jgi:hypothetical protein